VVSMNFIDAYLAVLADHPYAVVLGSSLVEAIGIPFPARIILILTPAFLATERDLVGLVAVATLGSLAGDHVPYLAARFMGPRVLTLYCRLTLGSDECVEKTLRCFARFGPWALLASRFSTSIRLFASACAGCRHISYPRYLMLDAVGTVAYTTLWVLVGEFVGERAVVFLTTDRRRWFFLVAVLTAFACVLAYRLWRRRRHPRASTRTLTRTVHPAVR
jgi:membrane protein DedA with SNARE-associated domain